MTTTLVPVQRGDAVFVLTTEHAASSYGVPVLVGEDGTAYGPADALPGEPVITAGDAVYNYRRWAREMLSDAEWALCGRFIGGTGEG
jgi:hypothetical protein